MSDLGLRRAGSTAFVGAVVNGQSRLREGRRRQRRSRTTQAGEAGNGRVSADNASRGAKASGEKLVKILGILAGVGIGRPAKAGNVRLYRANDSVVISAGEQTAVRQERGPFATLKGSRDFAMSFNLNGM